MRKALELMLSDILGVSTMTLATTDSNGMPHAAPVYFVHDNDLHFFFFSEKDSQHSRDIVHKSDVAGAIYPQCFDWRDIKGLQLRGKSHIVNTPSQWHTVWNKYREKFPFVRSLKTQIAKNRLYILNPSWIRLVDNSRGFGFKQEWDLS
jgi:uncharacterized protein YhbP (UPF0306 family)